MRKRKWEESIANNSEVYFNGVLPSLVDPLLESRTLACLRHLITTLFRNKLWGEKSTLIDLQALTELCRRVENTPRPYYAALKHVLCHRIAIVHGAPHISEIFRILPQATRDRIRCFLLVLNRYRLPTCRSFRLLLIRYLVPVRSNTQMAVACHAVLRYCRPLQGLYTEQMPFIWGDRLVDELLIPSQQE